MSDIKLYGFSVSPNVRKAQVALEHKGLDYELVNTFPGTKTPEYLAISPLGLIPGFEDGDFKVSDSNIIMEYLDERYPSKPILPSNPEDRARARWYNAYAADKLFPLIWILVNGRTKEEYRTGSHPEELVQETKNETLPDALDYLEAQLPGTGMFFDTLSIADIGIVSILCSVKLAGFASVFDPSRFPKLSAYVDAVTALPEFVKLAEAEKDLVNLVMTEDRFD
jgi:glutathione S-transferase